MRALLSSDRAAHLSKEQLPLLLVVSWRLGDLCRGEPIQWLPTNADVVNAGVPCIVLLLLLHPA